MKDDFAIPQTMMAQIAIRAEKEYPRECCGLIFGPKNSAALTRLRACRNAQDDYHAKDPVNFPRNSKSGYFLDPQELLFVQKEAREKDEEIKVIYHSHIDAPAVFSEEDLRQALYEGEPVYPGVSYFICSVRSGKAVEMSLYVWDAAMKAFCK